MKIIVDAFGGDNAPLEILKGCQQAVEELGVEIILTGDEGKIKDCAKQNDISLDKMSIIHTPEVMQMCDSPNEIIKSKKNTSMAVGLTALADGEGDAFVSAGSTGALAFGATFIVKRIKGIKRAAIASVMPSYKKPFMLLDCGANTECRAEMLDQFALMGSIYMNKVIGYDNPSVALANIGTEETKGGELQHSAYNIMKNAKYNFIGNIEARDVPFGEADVVVADGFTGNMLLKMYEGSASAILKMVKGIFLKSAITKVAALMLKPALKDFKARMDYTEYGGAAFLGISKPVIKAHGSSNAKAIKNAIRQAKYCVEGNIIGEIVANLQQEDV
ncbi:MAG: phosphate acyltransferase PlsX [Clostridiales bacterium]|nr:phosphate acyltransferase PlsX [Clostridiales bacterium]